MCEILELSIVVILNFSGLIAFACIWIKHRKKRKDNGLNSKLLQYMSDFNSVKSVKFGRMKSLQGQVH